MLEAGDHTTSERSDEDACDNSLAAQSLSGVDNQPTPSTHPKKENPKPNHLKKKKKHKKSILSTKEAMDHAELTEPGTWVQCCNPCCMKWRHLKEIQDPALVPDYWICSMNDEKKYNSCDKPEVDYNEEEHARDFVYTKYTEGSVVWARLRGYPRWPAMVEMDPDNEAHVLTEASDNMTISHIHVVFFDENVSRAWISINSVTHYNIGDKPTTTFSKGVNYMKYIKPACVMADEACKLSLKDRLMKYSFSKRFKGKFGKSFSEIAGQAGKHKQKTKQKSQKQKNPSQVPPLSNSQVGTTSDSVSNIPLSRNVHVQRQSQKVATERLTMSEYFDSETSEDFNDELNALAISAEEVLNDVDAVLKTLQDTDSETEAKRAVTNLPKKKKKKTHSQLGVHNTMHQCGTDQNVGLRLKTNESTSATNPSDFKVGDGKEINGTKIGEHSSSADGNIKIKKRIKKFNIGEKVKKTDGDVNNLIQNTQGEEKTKPKKKKAKKQQISEKDSTCPYPKETNKTDHLSESGITTDGPKHKLNVTGNTCFDPHTLLKDSSEIQQKDNNNVGILKSARNDGITTEINEHNKHMTGNGELGEFSDNKTIGSVTDLNTGVIYNKKDVNLQSKSTKSLKCKDKKRTINVNTTQDGIGKDTSTSKRKNTTSDDDQTTTKKKRSKQKKVVSSVENSTGNEKSVLKMEKKPNKNSNKTWKTKSDTMKHIENSSLEKNFETHSANQPVMVDHVTVPMDVGAQKEKVVKKKSKKFMAPNPTKLVSDSTGIKKTIESDIKGNLDIQPHILELPPSDKSAQKSLCSNTVTASYTENHQKEEPSYQDKLNNFFDNELQLDLSFDIPLSQEKTQFSQNSDLFDLEP